MKVYHLHREQRVEHPLEEVFAFFSRPENLACITPPAMDFHIITPSPIEMRCGALIDYTVRILGLRRRWTTLIAEFDPPRRFVDVQLRGPYSFWHHTHTFETDGAGTLVIDDIRYVLPLGVLGRVAHGLIVKPQLDRIFDFRRRTIQDMFSQVDDHASREHRLSNRD